MHCYCIETHFEDRIVWDCFLADCQSDAVRQHAEMRRKDGPDKPHFVGTVQVVALRPAVVTFRRQSFLARVALEHGVILYQPEDGGSRRVVRRCAVTEHADGKTVCLISNEPVVIEWQTTLTASHSATTNNSPSNTGCAA